MLNYTDRENLARAAKELDKIAKRLVNIENETSDIPETLDQTAFVLRMYASFVQTVSDDMRKRS